MAIFLYNIKRGPGAQGRRADGAPGARAARLESDRRERKSLWNHRKVKTQVLFLASQIDKLCYALDRALETHGASHLSPCLSPGRHEGICLSVSPHCPPVSRGASAVGRNRRHLSEITHSAGVSISPGFESNNRLWVLQHPRAQTCMPMSVCKVSGDATQRAH